MSTTSSGLSVSTDVISLSSGEFHTFRLPVPSLWLDILQKVKAAGLNGVSVYIHCMNLHSSWDSRYTVLTHFQGA